MHRHISDHLTQKNVAERAPKAKSNNLTKHQQQHGAQKCTTQTQPDGVDPPTVWKGIFAAVVY